MPGKGNPSKLIPVKKGDPGRNPYGRKGADGTGGFSLLTSYRKYIENAPPEAISAIWQGLIFKAQAGDTKAIELLLRMRNESILPTVDQAEAANRAITITIVDPGAVVSGDPVEDA